MMSCSGVDRNDRACSQSSSLFLCPLSCLLSQPDSSIPTIPFCFSWHRRLQRSASRCSKSAVIAARSKPISIPDSSILVFFFYQQIVYKSAKRRDATRSVASRRPLPRTNYDLQYFPQWNDHDYETPDVSEFCFLAWRLPTGRRLGRACRAIIGPRDGRETVVANRVRTFIRLKTSGGRVRYSRLLHATRCSMPGAFDAHARSRLDAQPSTQWGDKRRVDHEFLANIRDLSPSPPSLSSPFSLSHSAPTTSPTAIIANMYSKRKRTRNG